MISSKERYSTWANFLKGKREPKFRSAREFCAQSTLGISYPQYSRYESGEQLPPLPQVLTLCSCLDINAFEGVLEWNRAQLGEGALSEHVASEVERLLSEVREDAGKPERTYSHLSGYSGRGPTRSTPSMPVSLDDVIVFNRSHLKLFMSDPAYRDVFTYVNSFSPEWMDSVEIAETLGQPRAKIDTMLARLHDLGVLSQEGGKFRAAKSNFYFPDDAEFFEMRNMNLAHNTDAIMSKLGHDDLTSRRAYRGLITRELTPEQLDRVVSHLDEVARTVVNLPESPKAERIYSLCLLVGERFSRASR